VYLHIYETDDYKAAGYNVTITTKFFLYRILKMAEFGFKF
jgi:hypothetical protein